MRTNATETAGHPRRPTNRPQNKPRANDPRPMTLPVHSRTAANIRQDASHPLFFLSLGGCDARNLCLAVENGRSSLLLDFIPFSTLQERACLCFSHRGFVNSALLIPASLASWGVFFLSRIARGATDKCPISGWPASPFMHRIQLVAGRHRRTWVWRFLLYTIP